MPAHTFRLGKNRTLIVAPLGASAGGLLPRQFVALLPAYDAQERQRAETSIRGLLKHGCVEFCCIGPEAESLHDAIDAIIESDGAPDVVTTWISDESEGCYYFLHAAAGGRTDLLAAVDGHPTLHARILSDASGG